jgi:hypothetical protein
MSRKSELVKVLKKFSKKLRSHSPSRIRAQRFWLLRNFLINSRKPEFVNSGFLLPTVAMVSLVVVLLTTAILFRSFERSKNASNVRVNEITLNAALPAIERAKSKVEQLFIDPTLPRYTPSENSLYNAFVKDIKKYTFGDETPLTVSYDIDRQNGIENAGALDDRESIQTAWRFPVDTDNNGRFDSFTIYGIYFRSPSTGNNGKFDRARNPIEARTPPMEDGTLGDICSAAKGTSASLVGETGWYRSGGNLKKSFFIYSTTVPIKDPNANNTYGANFEENKSSRGFSALEFQQDQERIPIVNNAVVYEDDLEITPGAGLRLNGSIFTNSNLLTAQTFDAIRFYQVSSPESCFYRAENSKITVGGNVGNGRITGAGEGNAVTVDRYIPKPRTGPFSIQSSSIDAANRSANNTAGQIAYNTRAYAERINALVNQHLVNNPTTVTYTTYPNYVSTTTDPKEVRDNVKAKIDENLSLENQDDITRLRREELESYFKKRTRRVPFAEAPETNTTVQNTTGVGLQGVVSAIADTLRPLDGWVFPTNASTLLTLRPAQLPTTQPSKLKETYKNEEKLLGDRIATGNNLPTLWFDTAKNLFVGKNGEQLVNGTSTRWDDWSDPAKQYRYRSTQIDQLINLGGVTDRDGYFEDKATERPKNALDNVGGMRVITGAGIYVDGAVGGTDPGLLPWNATPTAPEWTPGIIAAGEPRSFLANSRPNWDLNLVDPTNTDPNKVWVNPPANSPRQSLRFAGLDPIIVWSDSMPMSPGNGQAGQKGDLLMRASAVYHYARNTDANELTSNQQTPIACISSYYNPSNAITAQNTSSLRSSWINPNADPATLVGGSNNGIVYSPYAGTRAAAITSNLARLRRQARLVFPDGRIVNENLRQAITNFNAGRNLSMAENSAVDTAICALQILNGTLTPVAAPIVPHGSIYETSFLDARQVKATELEPNVAAVDDPDYDRSIEERQPLEVRTTTIDLGVLRSTTITGANVIAGITEYLLPNSGLIYASREDALIDLSVSPSQNSETRKLVSPTDYKVDPTRRPNGIMLINGDRLDRGTAQNYRDEEKGLILASNVPVYVKGNFNRHSIGGNAANPAQEFTQVLAANWDNFYTRTTLNNNFACRPGDPRLPSGSCTSGDTWRPASVVADAVTILSDNFRFGFRNEGDYDLRNNEGNRTVLNYNWDGGSIGTVSELVENIDLNGDGDRTDTNISEANQISAIAVRRRQGFYDNNYLTSSDWSDPATGLPRNYTTLPAPAIQGSSYVNNFVTPIQRRVRFNEYVMEVCTKLPVTECQPADWTINGNSATPITATSQIGVNYLATTHRAGTTAQLSDTTLQRFARRVAFARNAAGNLILDNNGHPIALGIDNTADRKIRAFSNNGIPTGAGIPATPLTSLNLTTTPSALWFRTTDSLLAGGALPTDTNYGYSKPLFYQTATGIALTGTNPNEQPILVPVLQIQVPNGLNNSNPSNNLADLPTIRGSARNGTWVQRATAATTNLVVAGGDSPGRPSESNGGLENFIRYLEIWETAPNTLVNHSLSGSIIQYKRSAFATAPWQTVTAGVGNAPGGRSIYEVGSNDDGYRQYYLTSSTPFPGTTGGGMSPFYIPPNRQWGFDVALLSQLPDLFAQQFTLPPSTRPNEFFREVNRDDPWVQTLLCAKVTNTANLNAPIETLTNALPNNERPSNFCQTNTGG